MSRPLTRAFYARDVVSVARELLGRALVHDAGGIVTAGTIVETEAYGGRDDPGSHGRSGPRGRAAIMYGPSGYAYVYFTYGMHHCVNAVAGADGVGSAVLVRALEPIRGIAAMRARGAPASLPDRHLASGPGRLCRAMGIDRSLNGADLERGPLRVLDAPAAPEAASGPRVGLSADDGRAWRFWVPSSPAVSGSRRARM